MCNHAPCKNMPEPITVIIKGDLPSGYALKYPVHVMLHCENDEIGHYYCIGLGPIHGIGDSVEEAIEDFKIVLVDFYEVLEEESWRLAPHLARYLKELRELLIHQP